jgi:UDP-N-acetylmuramoyl-tripeptide--D-alanyl-D-alanine ligase
MASLIPENQARFSHRELIEATQGSCPVFEGEISGISTDSRAALAGKLFVALPGERFDGHDFVAAASRHGARVVMVERASGGADPALQLRVRSTLEALGHLARFHRDRWGGRVIGVAGSVGKTTTRSATSAVALAAGTRVHSPPGNLNNLIGVPMVLLGLLDAHALAVVEIGTNQTGEVARLSQMVRPDLAVLTRISLEHAEGLGGLDAIELEEGAVLRGLSPQGIAVVNADDERCLRQAASCAARRIVRYGLAQSAERSGAEYRIVRHQSLSPQLTRVRIARPSAPELELDSPLLGLPGAYALTAAIAANEALLERPLEVGELQSALASPALGEPGRLSAVELGDGSLVLDDTYNASPASVRSSAAVARDLARQRGSRLVLVIGEMRELGSFSGAAHRELGPDLAGLDPDVLIAFGGDAQELLVGLEGARARTAFALDAPGALELLESERRPGDVILVKASRGLRAERIVAGLSAGIAVAGAEGRRS